MTLTAVQLVKKLPAFYGPLSFITAFTRFRNLSLCWTKSVQYMSPHFTSSGSFLLLASYVSLPSRLFPSGFHARTLYAPLPIHAAFPAHLFRDFIARMIIGEEYTSYITNVRFIEEILLTNEPTLMLKLTPCCTFSLPIRQKLAPAVLMLIGNMNYWTICLWQIHPFRWSARNKRITT